MKKNIFIFFLFISSFSFSQLPCSSLEFRKFDFWIGKWEVFGVKGKAGDSKISLILDSCVILEEWTSTGMQKGLVFSGKSFNSYNTATKQWQQTWTDNTGNTTEYLRGEAGEGKLVFYADKVTSPGGRAFMRRLTFTKINENKVMQLGERSDDTGASWVKEFELEYRRKNG